MFGRSKARDRKRRRHGLTQTYGQSTCSAYPELNERIPDNDSSLANGSGDELLGVASKLKWCGSISKQKSNTNRHDI